MLLSPAEQMIFREVSVFSGGSSLEAMELVCACGADSGIDVLGTLASLVAKNLLFRVENDGDEQRFKMIALIREYGLELLKSSGTEKEIRDAHARYFLEVAEKTESDLTGPKQKEAFDRLEAEHDNFQTALEWLHEKEDGELELRLCGALRLYWQVRGYLSEGRENCRRALVRQERPTLRVRAGARLCAGTLAREQGDYTAAVEALEQAIKEYRDGKNAFGMSMALYELGMSLYRKGDLTGATERFKGARKSCASSDIIVQALADKGFGLVAEKEGRLDDAWAYFEKCRKVFSQVGDDRLLAQVVNNLANIYHGKGEYRKALESCKEALELSMKVRDETYIAYFLNNMGFFHSVLGEHDQALKSYESLRVIAARMGNRRMLALSYAGLADALLALGDRERALSDAQESVQLSERVGAGMELGVGLRSLGEVHLACGNLAAARQCFSRSIPLLEKFIELDDQEDLKRAQIGYKISVREM
jgi:tetratricopeptide (TPR) repeat protein